jgi:hypothetical protein
MKVENSGRIYPQMSQRDAEEENRNRRNLSADGQDFQDEEARQQNKQGPRPAWSYPLIRIVIISFLI